MVRTYTVHKATHKFFDEKGTPAIAVAQMRAYRDRNRRKRVAWRDLPAATQRAIVAYLES